MTVKISRLEIENVKRVKAVMMEPVQDGLTIIGGDNKQGKTSVLDAIAWALGGEKYKPSEPRRDGSVTPPDLHIEMSNGIVVERKGKNADLKVIDASGNKGGQQLLNEFVSQLALDLPKFMQGSAKDKANTLLRTCGVGEKLYELEKEEHETYNKRHTIGQIADQKKKYAAELTIYPEAPANLISASDLIKQQQAILAKNGENERMRNQQAGIEAEYNNVVNEIAELKKKFTELERRQIKLATDRETARKTAAELNDESTTELEENIAGIEEMNRKVLANLDKERADADAAEYAGQYDSLTEELNNVREQKIILLAGADLPLAGLSVEEGELIYNGYKWDNISGSEQLKIATAIVRKTNPRCGFVLIDKLEQMDINTLREFGTWLAGEGLQAIATRVSIGDECSIIIQDGYATLVKSPQKNWEAGNF